MRPRRFLALTDAWRLQLLIDPVKRAAVLEELRAITPPLELIDWEGPTPVDGSTLIVAALDLSTAELLLKVKPTIRVIAMDHLTSGWTARFAGQSRFLQRARAVQANWVRPSEHPRELPERLAEYLAPALEKAARIEGGS